MTTKTKRREKTKAAPKQPAKKMEVAPRPPGKPPRGQVAEEARWHAKVTLKEDATLQRLANVLTHGNKSEALRVAVTELAAKLAEIDAKAALKLADGR